jgi:hypothetical protein
LPNFQVDTSFDKEGISISRTSILVYKDRSFICCSSRTADLDLLLLRLLDLLDDRECPEEEEVDVTEAVDDAYVDVDPRRCGFREGTEEKLAVFSTSRLLMGKDSIRFGKSNVISRMFCCSSSSSKSKMPKSSSFT